MDSSGLPEVIRHHGQLAVVLRLIIRDSLRTVCLRLWDEEQAKLISIHEAQARYLWSTKPMLPQARVPRVNSGETGLQRSSSTQSAQGERIACMTDRREPPVMPTVMLRTEGRTETARENILRILRFSSL